MKKCVTKFCAALFIEVQFFCATVSAQTELRTSEIIAAGQAGTAISSMGDSIDFVFSVGQSSPIDEVVAGDDTLFSGLLYALIPGRLKPGQNRAPEVKIPILDQMLTLGDLEYSVDLNSIFDDADGDILSYQASSTDSNIAEIALSINILKVYPKSTGSATIKVNANDGRGGAVDDKFIVTIKLPPYPGAYNINHTFNFPTHSRPDEYQAKEYRILGMPGASDRSIADFFSNSGKQDEGWEVYRDNGAATAFFIKFDGTSDFFFTAGRAFWVIHKGPWGITETVPTAPLNNTQEAEISLRAGWNLITNPFDARIAWAKIQSVNGITEPIWSYNATFDRAADFEPYEGYYFDNSANLQSLRIPYRLLFETTLDTKERDIAKWRIEVILSTAKTCDKSTSLGVAEEADNNLDRFDLRKPRAIATTPSVEFKRPQWDAQYNIFATDIRPEFEGSASWEFDVHAIPHQPTQLAFTGIQRVPPHFDVYLINESRAQPFNLREDSLYQFTPLSELMSFKVIVGRNDIVQEQLSALSLPKEFAVGPNYPNPFSANGTFGNPRTHIPIAIPRASEITLKVYNLLGEEVQTIYAGGIEAGRYSFSWNGRDKVGVYAASGVYFYKLTTSDGRRLVGKMLLMRK